MKTLSSLLSIVWLLHLAADLQAAPADPAPTRPASKPSPAWVTAYYPVWHQQDGTFPPGKIDFTTVTHLIHFSVLPRADGTINDTPSLPAVTITRPQSSEVVRLAHAAGRKALLCVGGADTAPVFRPAITDAIRPQFASNLVSLALARGYDGLDIDMEPITDADAPQYGAFIRALRTKMSAARPGLLLTAATSWEPALFARLQDQFDQINVMTYDLSGPWPGFKTWHNSSLQSAAVPLLPGVPYPSAQGAIQSFLQAGVPPHKLELGIAFYGDVWTGADAPQQSIQGVTMSPLSYAAIMDQYYQPDRYHWDSQAHASYLTITAPDLKDRRFVSYDDERLCAEKVTYTRQHGLGGVFIWELGDGYRPSQPVGRQNPLLDAVRKAYRAPTNRGEQTLTPPSHMRNR